MQEEGYTGDVYCTDCGIKLSSGKSTKKYDHDWDGGKVTKEATCKEEGTKTYTCENCGETETFSIEKTEHNYIKEQHKNAPAQKMDIRFLFVRPVMIRKKKKLLQRVIPKELEIKNCNLQSGRIYWRYLLSHL